MPAALIVMTILGCDDGLTQCRYVDTVPTTYQSVALCDDALEGGLDRYTHSDYSSIIAVCRTPEEPISAALGDVVVEGMPVQVATEDGPQVDEPQATMPPSENRLKNLANGALSTVSSVLPRKDQVRTVVTAPVHIVTDSYSWVARKLVH